MDGLIYEWTLNVPLTITFPFFFSPKTSFSKKTRYFCEKDLHSLVDIDVDP